MKTTRVDRESALVVKEDGLFLYLFHHIDKNPDPILTVTKKEEEILNRMVARIKETHRKLGINYKSEES